MLIFLLFVATFVPGIECVENALLLKNRVNWMVSTKRENVQEWKRLAIDISVTRGIVQFSSTLE